MTGPMVRVAAAQFAVGTDPDENLATVERMLRRAAAESPDVVVLPEFCNHLSIYDDGDHAWRVAVELDGPFVTRVREVAAELGVWVQLNCTVRRGGPSTSREPAPGRITNTNLLIGPDGALAADNDKTVLMGAEGDYLSGAREPSRLVDTPFGTVGTYACMDGVVPEVPRSVALRGAVLMLNSLNSFALDEATLHVPVRAAENRVWVVACCKVGPLLPPEKVEAFSAAMQVPGEFLSGAGESQIVAPDGTVVARGPRTGEAVVVADVDLSRTGQLRPDGTDLRAARRPELYAALAGPTPPVDDHPRASELLVAAATDLADAAEAVRAGARLVVLPELTGDVDAMRAVADQAPPDRLAVVVGSLVDEGAHVGVVVDRDGVVASQPQLHAVARHGSWQHRLGDAVVPVDLPWGRLAVLVGEDVLYPETARLAALAGCDVLAVPFDAQEAWECELGLVERAAENRVCLVAATRTSEVGRSMVVTLPPDFTLWAPSRQRTFDGTINQPDVTRAPRTDRTGARGTVHPARSLNRQISKGTNLVDGRPWRLFEDLASPAS
jgi:predicted amidohydrolase